MIGPYFLSCRFDFALQFMRNAELLDRGDRDKRDQANYQELFHRFSTFTAFHGTVLGESGHAASSTLRIEAA